MSQYGMQMPGGRSSRGPSMGVIDGLLLLAFVAMAVAAYFMWQAAAAVSPQGQPWQMHGEGPITLPE